MFCHITSQVTSDKHQDLLKAKGGTGFPYLVFMDVEGNVSAKPGDRTVAGFETTRSALVAFDALEAKAKKGDKAAAVDALIAGMEMGRIQAEEANARLSKLGKLPAAKQAKIDALLVASEVDALMKGVRTKPEAAEVGRKFAAMEKAGKVPTGRTALSFYAMMLEAHEADKDAKAFAATLKKLTKAAEGERNADKLLKRYEATLKKLQDG